ncbi:MAG: di-trans,poly-cis-decaprenylcistransferase [Limnohabitans sp.]|nr:di-trans,poly-cis-decaprenylcistransferase [Limnohabitans sp.]
MSTESSLPQHIAIIMDGNGRWAKKRFLPRTVGHVKGAAGVRRIVKACADRDIRYLTLFAFSTENWRRPPEEVSTLMDLFVQYLQKEMADMSSEGVRLRVIGDRSAFPADLQARIAAAEQATAHNTTLHLTVAANYGGQWDILQATRAWQTANPGCTLDDLHEADLAAHLSTADLPDPDLLIRTGGESRISNFLLWQCAYTELYFVDDYWPDFDEASLVKALTWFASRVRRFGRTDEQVAPAPTAAT